MTLRDLQMGESAVITTVGGRGATIFSIVFSMFFTSQFYLCYQVKDHLKRITDGSSEV